MTKTTQDGKIPTSSGTAESPFGINLPTDAGNKGRICRESPDKPLSTRYHDDPDRTNRKHT